mmetsp:Transcript_85024/g.177693  ORF Transcript_85024/g.177693 Transcript_85024/m.177693 type:complete len:473 (-) Transcript_85024:322-1740(-)
MAGKRPPKDSTYSPVQIDSILRHLQQTESHDWLGEITHCCTQVGYLLLQNYNISRLNFYNYNFHLIILTALFFAQRIWISLWRVTQFSDDHGLRFGCHIVLFMVLLDSLYCGMQLVMKDSIAGTLYLVTPLLSSLLFHLVYLRSNSSSVFTAELFSMLSRCIYHSLETAYCLGVLPLKFLQYEYIYFNATRCILLTTLMAVHSFISVFCLELHSLGSEVLQQSRMLGEWRCTPDLDRSKSNAPKPTEWTHDNCPYPRGAVVRCKGRYYEAMSTVNTCTPTSPQHCIQLIAYFLGDHQRTKTLVLLSLLLSTLLLIPMILFSKQWSMYAAMIIPNCLHFLYVKYRRSHAYFNPAHLNLSQLQWDISSNVAPQYKLNSNKPSLTSKLGTLGQGDWIGLEPSKKATQALLGEEPPIAVNPGAPSPEPFRLRPDPLFLSAVSTSTMFFFGPSGGSGRAPSDHPSSAPSNAERSSRD